jgi:hypothetical protein
MGDMLWLVRNLEIIDVVSNGGIMMTYNTND